MEQGTRRMNKWPTNPVPSKVPMIIERISFKPLSFLCHVPRAREEIPRKTSPASRICAPGVSEHCHACPSSWFDTDLKGTY